MKPCIWSSPYLVMVKSNMAAKKGTSCNLLNTWSKVINLVSLSRLSWQRNQMKQFSKMIVCYFMVISYIYTLYDINRQSYQYIIIIVWQQITGWFYATHIQINCLNNVSLDPLQYVFRMEEGNLEAESFPRPLLDNMATNCNCMKCATSRCPCREENLPCSAFFASASQMSIFLVRTGMDSFSFMNSR